MSLKLLNTLFAVTLALLAGCSNGSAPLPDTSSRVISIAHLKSLCHSESTPINDTYYVEGEITANDLFGELSHSIVIEDLTGGIVLYLEGEELHHTYKCGSTLRIFCQGLFLGDYGGKVVLGAKPTDRYSVDRLSKTAQQRHIKTLDKELNIEPKCISIRDMDITYADRLVVIQGVFIPSADGTKSWCECDSLGMPINTTHILCDQRGDSLEIFIPSTCRYGAEPLPAGIGIVCGIGDYFNHKVQLRVVNHNLDFQP